jgi:hypothetical protein
MTWLNAVAAVLLGAGTVLVLAMGADRAAGLVDGLASWVAVRTPDVAPVAMSVADLAASALPRGLPVLIALAFCLLAAPIALYFALHDE